MELPRRKFPPHLSESRASFVCELICLQYVVPATGAGTTPWASQSRQKGSYSCVATSPLRCTTTLTPDLLMGVAPNFRRSWATSPLYLRGI
jgi:hypothetical protein